ncbi:MAG: chromate transporter [Tissierellia bacterium]|nr:chromate transporter [Tissierellia bacterium]
MGENVNKKISLLELFLTFFRINAITFGGGYTIVAVLRDEFMLRKKIISEEEMLDLVAIAQSGPGAMAINTSVLIGYKLRGVAGAITCMLASVAPCIIVISIISLFYQEFRTNFYINAALMGMSGVISAVLVVTTIGMARNVLKQRAVLSGGIMIVAFLLSFVFNVNSALIIFGFGILGLILFSVIDEGGGYNI